MQHLDRLVWLSSLQAGEKTRVKVVALIELTARV